MYLVSHCGILFFNLFIIGLDRIPLFRKFVNADKPPVAEDGKQSNYCNNYQQRDKIYFFLPSPKGHVLMISKAAWESQDKEDCPRHHIPSGCYISKYATSSACPSINSLLGSTSSPMSLVNTLSASTASSTFT